MEPTAVAQPARTAPEGWHHHPNGGGLVHDTATVPESVRIPAGTRVWYGASIGSDASIGYGASIGSDASIGYGASIGSDVLGYRACAWAEERGVVVQYGCVTALLPEWRERLRTLCEQHEPARVEVYERGIGAFLDLVESVIVGAEVSDA